MNVLTKRLYSLNLKIQPSVCCGFCLAWTGYPSEWVSCSPNHGFSSHISQLDSPGSEFEQPIIVMVDGAVMRFGVKAQWGRNAFAKFPDAELFALLIDPLRAAIDVDRFVSVMNISQRYIWINLQVLSFVRCGPRNSPANWSVPNWMQDARPWATFAVHRCHRAIDRL